MSLVLGWTCLFLCSAACLFLFLIICLAFRFDFLSADFQQSAGGFCTNLHECFVSTLTFGLRNGGGIGEHLSTSESATTHFYGRFAFDMAFWILISVISMNLILGPSRVRFCVMTRQSSFTRANQSQIHGQKRCVLSGAALR